MASEESPRPHVFSIRLSDDERDFRDAIAEHQGIDGAAVFRKGMLDYGRSVGLEFPLKRKNSGQSRRNDR